MVFNPVTFLAELASDAQRIFVVSRKPTMQEYQRMALIVALGIVVIGIIAYAVFFFFTLTGIGR